MSGGNNGSPGPKDEKWRSRGDIDRELERLTGKDCQENEKPTQEPEVESGPEEIELVAMCYELAFPEESYEYICPVCGEKTNYELDAIPTTDDVGLAESMDQLMGDVDDMWRETDDAEQEFSLTRAEIRDNLKRLLRRKPSEKERPMRKGQIPPEAFVHHGVPSAMMAELLTHGLTAMKREANTIRGFEVRLDERQFCRKCSPNVVQPQLGLVVSFRIEKKEVHTQNITQADLDLLVAFSTFCLAESDEEIPVSFATRKSCLRLVELLGFRVAERD